MKKNELKAKMTQEDIQDLDSITENDYIELQKKFNSLLKMDEPNIALDIILQVTYALVAKPMTIGGISFKTICGGIVPVYSFFSTND